MIAGSMMLVIMPVVMTMCLRIAAMLGPSMPVRIAAIRMRMAQFEPGQAAEDDQAGKQDMQDVVTRSGHDGIRRLTRRKRTRSPTRSYQTGFDTSTPQGRSVRRRVAPALNFRLRLCGIRDNNQHEGNRGREASWRRIGERDRDCQDRRQDESGWGQFQVVQRALAGQGLAGVALPKSGLAGGVGLANGGGP